VQPFKTGPRQTKKAEKQALNSELSNEALITKPIASGAPFRGNGCGDKQVKGSAKSSKAKKASKHRSPTNPLDILLEVVLDVERDDSLLTQQLAQPDRSLLELSAVPQDNSSEEPATQPLGSQNGESGGDPHEPAMINPNNPIKDPGKRTRFKDLVTKRRLRQCFNRLCGAQEYGNSDNGWSRRKLGKGQFFWLCRTCKEAWQNNQFCTICYQIYLDPEANSDIDGKEWVQCEAQGCRRWMHVDCEALSGTPNIRELLYQESFESEQGIVESSFVYWCPPCKQRKQQLKRPATSEVSLEDKEPDQEKQVPQLPKELVAVPEESCELIEKKQHQLKRQKTEGETPKPTEKLAVKAKSVVHQKKPFETPEKDLMIVEEATPATSAGKSSHNEKIPES